MNTGDVMMFTVKLLGKHQSLKCCDQASSPLGSNAMQSKDNNNHLWSRGKAYPQGPVYALAAANNMLFSGGHDFSIRVYQFNQPAGLFQEAVSF